MSDRNVDPEPDCNDGPPVCKEGAPGGCPMCDGLYLKANGELPCWCFYPAEYKILKRLDLEELRSPGGTILGLPVLEGIRESFRRGEIPYPDLCPDCPGLGVRSNDDLRADTLDHLLIEPSYLCTLDCPECLSPSYRLTLKEPPHILSLEFFQLFLDRLRSDGIRHVRLADFEGRGDPMLNRKLGAMIKMVRTAFPGVKTMVTTHGNYPYQPFLMSGDLDLLRLSIDGANAESYARYRRGGSLETVLDLMRDIRAHRRVTENRLVVEWKYILFEWNDTDEELVRAARLAEEFETRLIFVITNTDGLSRRFSDPFDWFLHLRRLAPRARLTVVDDGFALGRIEDERRRLDEKVEGHLTAAFDASRRGWSIEAADSLRSALDAAGCRTGATPPDVFLPVDELPRVLEKITTDGHVEALAEIALANEEFRAAEILFRQFLRLRPETERRRDLEALLVNLVLRGRLGSADASDFFAAPRDRLDEAERALLRVHPGHHPSGGPPTPDDDPADWLEHVLDSMAVRALGYLRWARGDLDAAHYIFSSYLETPREEEESRHLRWALKEIDAARS